MLTKQTTTTVCIYISERKVSPQYNHTISSGWNLVSCILLICLQSKDVQSCVAKCLGIPLASGSLAGRQQQQPRE